MKFKNTFLTTLLFTSLLLASCGGPESQMTGKWKIESISDIDQEQMKELGLDKITLELNSDKSLNGKWMDMGGSSEITEQKGKWMFNEMELDGAIGDLFLQFEGGQDIIEVTSVNENKLVLHENRDDLTFTFSKN